ncbi:MAG TPA: hypothetical protein VJ550_08940, partial [Geomonas sp.]|nr:hypothetical protein [Geomonas sp.]
RCIIKKLFNKFPVGLRKAPSIHQRTPSRNWLNALIVSQEELTAYPPSTQIVEKVWKTVLRNSENRAF